MPTEDSSISRERAAVALAMLVTPGQIAESLDQSVGRVRRLLNTRRGDIAPVGRLGHVRAYDRSAISQVRDALAVIDKHLSDGTRPEVRRRK